MMIFIHQNGRFGSKNGPKMEQKGGKKAKYRYFVTNLGLSVPQNITKGLINLSSR